MAFEKKSLIFAAILGIIIAGAIVAGITTISVPPIQTPLQTTVTTAISTITTTVTTSMPTTTTMTVPTTTTVTATTTIPATELGTLILRITDAPSRTLKYLYIEVDEVRLHMKGNKTGEGPIVNFTVTPTIYNLTALYGNPEILGAGPVPNGTYTLIALHILRANATFAEDLTKNVTLTIVAEGWVKIPIHFKVEGGEYTVVTLDFDIEQSHVSAANVLRPVITGKVESE